MFKSSLIAIVTLLLLCPSFLCAEEKVKVGISLALTGALAEYGEAVRNGIELARKDRPELFTGIEFIYEDDAYDPKRGIANFRKFETIDKVDLIYTWGAEPSISLAPLAERSKLPFITQSPLVSLTKGRKYVLRFQYNDDKHGKVITEYFKKKGINKIGMLMSDLSFFEILSRGIEKHLKPRQQYEIITSVLPNEMDFRSIIKGKKLEQYDIVGVYLLPGQLRVFYKQLKELGVEINTFGTTTFESTSVLSDVMPLLEGIPYTHSSTSDEFLKSYKTVYGTNMHIGYAAGCYDFAILIGKLVNEGRVKRGMSGAQIISAFESVKPFTGVSGDVALVHTKETGTYFDFQVAVKKLVAGNIQTEYVLN